jgi:thiol-disulfide isomerase/thioredoxin
VLSVRTPGRFPHTLLLYFYSMKSTLITIGIAILLVSVFYIGKRYYLKPKIEVGIKAADISAKLADGTSFSLSDLKGKFVLLDFWGSWCKPCRESHPELIKLYNDFHSADYKDASGFEIVSFGVERSKATWAEAIRDDGLDWPYHLVSGDLFNSPVVNKFNVKQIPTKFLINPKGIIIAVDPSIEEVSVILRSHQK